MGLFVIKRPHIVATSTLYALDLDFDLFVNRNDINDNFDIPLQFLRLRNFLPKPTFELAVEFNIKRPFQALNPSQVRSINIADDHLDLQPRIDV